MPSGLKLCLAVSPHPPPCLPIPGKGLLLWAFLESGGLGRNLRVRTLREEDQNNFHAPQFGSSLFGTPIKHLIIVITLFTLGNKI